MSATGRVSTPGIVYRKDIAARIAELSGMGKMALAKRLGISVSTLDRVVCKGAVEATYDRVLPRLEAIEAQVDAYKAKELATSEARLRVLNTHADEVATRALRAEAEAGPAPRLALPPPAPRERT